MPHLAGIIGNRSPQQKMDDTDHQDRGGGVGDAVVQRDCAPIASSARKGDRASAVLATRAADQRRALLAVKRSA